MLVLAVGAVALGGCNDNGTSTPQLNGVALPYIDQVTSDTGTSAPFRLQAAPQNGTGNAPVVEIGATQINSVAVRPGDTITLDVVSDQPLSDIFVSVDGQPGAFDLPLGAARAASRAIFAYHVNLHITSTVIANQFLIHLLGMRTDGSTTPPTTVQINTIHDQGFTDTPPQPPTT